MNASPAPVVVGVDASAGSYDAARYAADEAQLRGVPLTLVHAYTWPWIDLPLTEEELTDPAVRDKARHLLNRIAHRIGAEYPDVPVVTELVEGPPPAVLVRRSGAAALLVVGHRGGGGFAELLVGSVAVHAAHHASCPLVVVRGTRGPPDAPVLVGVDGSAHSEATIRFALEMATRHKAPVLAVAVGPAHPTEAQTVGVGQALTRLVASVSAGYPDVAVDTGLRYDRSPAAALIRAGQGAGLVVVGSHGRGGLRGIPLGSVGRALIEHAPCPVAIVRHTP
jgi:nucleotide-binding universal stress UspA family protein